MTARIEAALAALDRRGRRRKLVLPRGLDFASNDYLGLAGSAILRDGLRNALARNVPVGAGGSRLLRGNHNEHEALEAEAASFFQTPAALFMGGGFQANQAIFSCLPAAGDLIIHDELIHASTHEGMRLGRADIREFRHNDADHAHDVICDWRARGGRGQIWIAIESLYSMEGDIAPLAAFDGVALAHDAILVIDEAHATGVFGPAGRGLAHGIADGIANDGAVSFPLKAQNVTLHTCGKALGVAGGLVCGPAAMIDLLVNRARPFVFATAPSPLNAALVRCALCAIATRPELQRAAQERMRHAHAMARNFCAIDNLQSQIIPVIIGDDHGALAWADSLQDQGFDVRAIRPPTVPRGTARLRISITANIGPADITALFDAVGKLRGKVK